MSESAASTAAARRTVTIAVGGDRLDRALAAALDGLSRSRIKALILAGQVAGTDAVVRDPDRRVAAGERYVVEIPPAAPATPAAQALPLAIVHEDAALIVIDKPAGLVVHPAPGNPDRTLVNALIAHCGDGLTGIGGARRPGIVHRLDKHTSGLIVAAKTAEAHASLVGQFAARSVDRRYRALVWGMPRPPAGAIAGNIGRDPRNRKKMAVLARGGRRARTHYELVRRLGPPPEAPASELACRLETGRTHQIRVHLASIGHPVIGDAVYGRARRGGRVAGLPEPSRAALAGLSRQALHAATLAFDHPVTGTRVEFESKLPNDLKILINILESI